MITLGYKGSGAIIMYLTPSTSLWFNFVYPSGKVAGTQWNQVVAFDVSASSEDYKALCDMSGGKSY